MSNPATKYDIKKLDSKVNKLENNVQKDIKHLGEIMVKQSAETHKLIKALPDKHYLDDKMGELRGETVVRHKRTIKAFRHLTKIVERNLSLDKADKKDIAIVKDLLNSAP